MGQNTHLKLDRIEVEKIIKHFLDSGHNFHFSPNSDPGLTEAELRFQNWSVHAEEALDRCFLTKEIAERFKQVPSQAPIDGETTEQVRHRALMNAYNHRREYLKRLKGTLAIYEVAVEPKATGRFSDRDLMLRAIELARKCVSEPGKVSPKVGAVIARDGIILGEAFRGEIEPGEHAEYTLFERKLAGETLAGATLFTTLEPCTSRNDPKIPCARRVIERRIGKVFIGTLDRNPTVLGKGEISMVDAGIQIARFDSDLIPILDELNREFLRQYQKVITRKRTKAETKDPVEPEAVGPNGFKIGYTENGDKVEWIIEDGETWPMILRRNDSDILCMYNELWEKVWYIRKIIMLEKMERGEIPYEDQNQPHLVKARERMKAIEEKYGRENLGWDDVEWGIVQGKLSALAWVMGAEWEESLDT